MPAGALVEVARYRVLFDDCDPMRIMYYGGYCRLLEIGWTELLRRLGQPLPALLERGLHLQVAEVGCRYLKPARYDDELVIKAGLTDIGPERFTIEYEIRGPGGDVLATGRTLHALCDEVDRPRPMPPEFLRLPVIRGTSVTGRV